MPMMSRRSCRAGRAAVSWFRGSMLGINHAMGLVACVHAKSKACSLSHVEQGVHGVRRVELCRGWRTSLVLCLSLARRSVCVAVTGDGARACIRVRREGPGEGAARTSVRPHSVVSLLQSGVGQVFGVGQRRHEAIRAQSSGRPILVKSCGSWREDRGCSERRVRARGVRFMGCVGAASPWL
jgi:hypothetical protein